MVYDGDVILQHRDANNVPTLTLTRGLDLSDSLQGAGGIGGLLAMTESSGTSSYYHSDGGGNVTALANANQLVVGKYSYDPFGGTLSISGPKAVTNPYRFSSKPIHDLSGHYDYLYRWYSPVLQRWLNCDPIEEEGGLNLHAYVENDPANGFDPLGLAEGYMYYKFQNGKKVLIRTPDQNPNEARNEALRTFWDEGGRDATRTVAKPMDWAMTVKEIENDPKNPWLYAGMVLPSRMTKCGEKIHANRRDSPRITTLYALLDGEGKFLKWGITSMEKIERRYTKSYLYNKDIVGIIKGTREMMLKLERKLVESKGGPLNHEPWSSWKKNNP